ncbi:SRPBCC family protein [Rhodococcus sp. 14C212]|uniref:SRPBCC family protein n=1 Tax=Rhodococcus sp. 14C212 TaxID=2711209 RepID=UPI0013EA35E5|nr:SRPBCC family protein [Rhodococcus sp. 14C212]NGP09129.1 SRPBCC family protein [Rhodococcus sp. 14C212]
MSETAQRDTTATPQQVWDVLADGWSYASWVVGASRIRAVDDAWPAVGSRIHHSVGVWPALLNDHTEVVESIPGKELKLRARAWPAGQAEITMRLHERPGGCRIEMAEKAAAGPAQLIPGAVQARLVLPRNVECLRRLMLMAEHATEPKGVGE